MGFINVPICRSTLSVCNDYLQILPCLVKSITNSIKIISFYMKCLHDDYPMVSTRIHKWVLFTFVYFEHFYKSLLKEYYRGLTFVGSIDSLPLVYLFDTMMNRCIWWLCVLIYLLRGFWLRLVSFVLSSHVRSTKVKIFHDLVRFAQVSRSLVLSQKASNLYN